MILGIQKAIDQSYRTKTKPIENIGIEIKLSPTIFLLLIQVSFKPRLRPTKKRNATKKIIKEITQPLESILLRLQKKTRIRTRLKIWTRLSVIPISRKVTMPTSIIRSQKTSGGLGKLYVNNSKEKERRIETETLYLVFHNLQGLDKDLTRFRKQS